MGQAPYELRSASIVYDPTGGVPFAGQSSFYIFNFKTVSFVPKGSYFRITLPRNAFYSALPMPTCSFVPVLGQTPSGSLSCKFTNGQIVVTGLAQDLAKERVLSLRVQLTNPSQTVKSPLFRIEVIRDKTQYVYDWKDKLIGPDVQPGVLKSISVTPLGDLSELAKGKTDGYTFSFTTSNPIQLGGMIEVAIPSSFVFLDLSLFDKPTTYYITGGLVSVNSTEKVMLAFSDSTFK